MILHDTKDLRFLGVQEKTIVKNQKIFRQCYVSYVDNVSESLLNT